ncbi:MAG: hypothetical protein WCC81_16640 [Pseudolabrys sp.]
MPSHTPAMLANCGSVIACAGVVTAKAKAAKAINLIIRFPPMSSDFPEAWIVVALAQQSLIQIKMDLAGAETAGIAADPIFGEVWLRGG